MGDTQASYRRTHRLRVAVALLALPLAVTTVLASAAAAASSTITASGSIDNLCTGTEESLTATITVSTTKQGDEVLVRVTATGTTSGGFRLKITGEADRPASSSTYTIPVVLELTGPGGSFTVRGTATVSVDANGNPTLVSLIATSPTGCRT